MEIQEIVELLTRTMQRLNQVPKNAAHKKHFFFKASDYFQVQLKEIVLLESEQPSGFPWLIWPKSPKDPEPTHFVVVPNQVANAVLAEAPKSFPAGQKDPSRVVAAKWNVRLRVQRETWILSGPGSHSVDVSEYCDRADLFTESVLPNWDSLDEKVSQRDLNPPTKECPRCREMKFPTQLKHDYDVQCSNGKCRLWYKGIAHAPETRGFWTFNQIENQWQPWDQKPLSNR